MRGVGHLNSMIIYCTIKDLHPVIKDDPTMG